MASLKKITIFTLLCLMCSCVYAQDIDAENILNSLTDNFLKNAEQSAKPIIEASERLFWMLLPISIVISGIKNLFKDANIQNFMFDLIKLMIVTGIFYFLLSNGKDIGFSIVDSFTTLADGKTYGPSELLDLTLNIVAKCQKLVHKNFLKMVPMLIEYTLLICFALIMFMVVLKFTVLFITAKIVCIIGVFVLGFGSFNFTRDLAVNYLKVVLSLSVQLLTMLTIINTSCMLLTEIYEKATEFEIKKIVISYNECISILFVSLFLYALSKTLPSVMAQLIGNFTNMVGFEGSLSKTIGNIRKLF